MRVGAGRPAATSIRGSLSALHRPRAPIRFAKFRVQEEEEEVRRRLSFFIGGPMKEGAFSWRETRIAMQLVCGRRARAFDRDDFGVRWKLPAAWRLLLARPFARSLARPLARSIDTPDDDDQFCARSQTL